MTIDRQTGRIYVYELVPVGEPDEDGEYHEFEERDVTPDDVSRIAAQNAKSVISSIVREAGRQSIYEEFSAAWAIWSRAPCSRARLSSPSSRFARASRPSFPITTPSAIPRSSTSAPPTSITVITSASRFLIVDVRDPCSDEPRQRGEQVRPPIVVSRTHPDLIRRLFEIEVPEIYDGMVEIKSIAREPGARSKVAVSSRESNLDPVGACVGPKGSRVRMVVEELRNERVDVIQWSADPATYVANALSPAKVSRVSIDEANHYATVVVPDDQLSSRSARRAKRPPAARLTGWHIDIKSASFSSEPLPTREHAHRRGRSRRCRAVLLRERGRNALP